MTKAPYGDEIAEALSSGVDRPTRDAPVVRLSDRGGTSGREVNGLTLSLDGDGRVRQALAGTALEFDVLGPVAAQRLLLGVLSSVTGCRALLCLGRRSDDPAFEESDTARLRPLLSLVGRCEALGDAFQRDHTADLVPLTRREREIVEYVCLGLTNREIALACGSSANTVRNQLASIFQKMGATTRAELVRLALEYRIAELRVG